MSTVAEQQRPDVHAKRQQWRAQPAGIDPARFVFVDETRAHTALSRLYGRAVLGQRVVGHVPQAHYHKTTLVSALR